MADDCGKPDPTFTKVTPNGLTNSLATAAIPLADALRDLYTQFGLRRYTVSIVTTRWTGARRGVGQEVVERSTLLQPTPLLTDLAGVQEIAQAVGLDEIGSVAITEISGAYSEEILRGLDVEGNPPEPNVQVYYEILFVYPNGDPGERRRFFIKGVPEYQPGKFQWFVRLERARMDRNRLTGDPEN